jgi:hypothetical protein
MLRFHWHSKIDISGWSLLLAQMMACLESCSETARSTKGQTAFF